MKSYDLVYIVRPDLDADAQKAVTERLGQRITDQGGTIEAVDVWGKKRMTFTVKKYREGVFVHTRFALDPRKLEEIRRAAALSEDVLRATITNAVGKLAEPKPEPKPEPKAEPEAAPAMAAAAPAAPEAPRPAETPGS
ncbi:MAG TPA: 30S ribosomal protein S6 [bacterium]|nr:30S ribosomal protein S6 [bacterium]